MSAVTLSEEIQSLLSPVDTFNAAFEQEITTESGEFVQKSFGTMLLKKPGLFRWEIKKPEHAIVVANGKKLWNYDQELEQVTIQDISNNANTTLMLLLSGEFSAIENDYIVENKGCEKNSDRCFKLTPKSEMSDFQWISLGFKESQLREINILDHLGQISKIIFNKIKVNDNIASNMFEFQIPKGTEVVDNSR